MRHSHQSTTAAEAVRRSCRLRPFAFMSCFLFALLVLLPHPAKAQHFFNLTAQQVKIDSLLPVFTYSQPLGYHYADSIYTVSIVYPEFIPMSDADVQRYHAITDKPLPELPVITQDISVSRKAGSLDLSMVPLVCRNGQYQKLVSFMLKIESQPCQPQVYRVQAPSRAGSTAGRYADHSVLQSGSWVKIRVPKSGIYQLTEDVVRRAGFTSLSKVKIYGYGGALQPERLTASYLTQTDDLQEVPTCTSGSRRLFYAVGPVTWNDGDLRIRNPYSNYGYYFLTENDDEPLTIDSEEFLDTHYPLADDYNTLYEVDDYAWYHGGRNLYDAQPFTLDTSRDYTLECSADAVEGLLTVSITASGASTATISMNDSILGTLTVKDCGEYDAMQLSMGMFDIYNLKASNKVTIRQTAGNAIMRLDYISLWADAPKAAPDLAAQSFPVPELVYSITNQDHHADGPADMIIIIPTTQRFVSQAERLKALHEEHDSLRVRIVPADELFNEYSSGTPDANAYRRYLKMLYDRAETDADMPRYLLLFGDGAWDNRMLSSDWNGEDPDDFLLCYESENSYSHTDCYVSDDYFCMLDDNEGGNLLRSDKADVAVGRLPARTLEEATTLVDKITDYISNQHAGSWQNTICFMGDDGNNNSHMDDADSVATMVEQYYPTYLVKRIMWDAYTRQSSSTGNSYPDVTRLIKQQMSNGALIMNYSGHGAAYSFSHEYVVELEDFETTTSNHLPLWVTCSCDIMPFDGQEENIGEAALFNKKGGAIAFYGTTRTVYQSYNRLMNLAFMRHVLSTVDGQRLSIGEAVRQAKNGLINTDPNLPKDLTTNKLQYTLLGDPALVLASPTLGISVDSINGTKVDDSTALTLKAGTTVTVAGHVLTSDGQLNTDFNGLMTATVRDAREQITCKLNDRTEAEVPFVYYDRPKTLFSGSDSIYGGRFKFSFAVPKDISYSEATGLMNLYAVNNAKTEEASGINESFQLYGSGNLDRDTIGPSIYCYLNSSSFTNGGSVNPTPYFVAELSDEDGINATGNGIGHDLQLIIDGDMAMTYNLNDYFQYDFGSYTRGTVGYSLPTLSYGEHKLLFRAWDVLNNSSVAELSFRVEKNLEPVFFDVECTKNPATTNTSFRIIHDRTGSELDIVLDIFDISGRHLWSYAESGVTSDNTYTVDWDLTVDGGRRLHTGVYLYRLRIRADGSTYASKAKKLIILTDR